MASSTKGTIRLGLGALGLLASLGGCSDDGRLIAGPGKPTPDFAILSEPLPDSRLSDSLLGTGPAGGWVDSVTFVYIPPGTITRGARVVIRNLATGIERTGSLIDGGLDPVAVPASVGDTLEVTATDSSGAITSKRLRVPAARPPRVVRTVPARGKTDVPLNSKIVVVFSEPVDGRTVTTQTVQFLRGGQLVSGQVLLASDGLRVEFIPDEALSAGTSYRLVITTGVKDVSGDRLEQAEDVDFTSGSVAALVDSLVLDHTALTLAPGDSLRLTAQAYDATGNEVTGVMPTWLSNDTRIAAVSASGVVTGVALGTTIVSATVDGATAMATINITQMVFASVSAGYYHSCGLTTDGSAYCWGYNEEGALGNGSTIDSPTPVAVAGGLRFTLLTVGGGHSCALISGGEAYCWGSNWSGHLGTVTADRCPGSDPCSTRPVAVAGGLRFSALTAGTSHTCGVTSDGAAYCWGSNLGGELGNGTKISSATPVAVAGGHTFTSVSAGRGTWRPATTCGVSDDGGTYCWGYNQHGQLGNGSSTGPESCPIPGSYPRNCSTVPVAVATGTLAFTAVRAGVFHACGLTASGSAHCWGYLGNWGSSSLPMAIGAGRTYRAIELFSGEVSYSQICLVASGGTAYCRNGGESDLGLRPVPGGITFASVSPGNFHACGVSTEGKAYCWGANFAGQLGNGTLTDSSVPAKVAGQP